MIPFSPNEEAAIKREVFEHFRMERIKQVRKQSDQFERLNAQDFRENMRVAQSERDQALRMQELRCALDKMDSLLIAREEVSERIAAESREAAAAEQRRLERTRRVNPETTLRRSRDSLVREQASQAAQERVYVERLINAEKAKQLAETARLLLASTTDSSDDPAETLEAIYRRMEANPIRHLMKKVLHRSKSPSAPAAIITEKRESTVTRSDLNRVKHKPIFHSSSSSLASTRARSENHLLADIRKSIDSVRRSSFDQKLELPAVSDSPPGSPIKLSDLLASRERMDPLKTVERKRAALAALKLKKRPL